jgi:invasion protein IalB
MQCGSICLSGAVSGDTVAPVSMSPGKDFAMFLRRFITGVAAAAFLSVASFVPASAQEAAPQAEPKIEKFGTWSPRCEKNSTGAERCHAFVGVASGPAGEQQERVLYMGISYGPLDSDKDGNQDLLLFAIVPLGTFLPAGMTWSIDGKDDFSQQFVFCVPGGCQTEILLTDERLAALKKGNQLEVAFRLLAQGEVKIPVKLDGITKAIDSLPKPKKS